MGPASTIPRTPPPPRTADIHAVPRAILSASSSSRMIPKASGKIAPPQPLHRPRGDHDVDGRGQRGDEGAGADRVENAEKDAPAAVEIAQAPCQRRGDGGREQEHREHPRRTRRRRVETLLDRRQRRHDQRLQQRVAAAGEDEDGEQEARTPMACEPHAHSFVTGVVATASAAAPRIVSNLLFGTGVRSGARHAARR